MLGVLGGAAVWPAAARGQTPGRVYRIGYMATTTRRPPTFAVLLDELRLAGFIEGQNLTVVEGGFGAIGNELAAATTALVDASPDAIFAPGFVTAKAAQTATKTIPILTISEDLIAEGLTSSLARPDRNTTGISLLSLDLDGKRGESLLEAIPDLRHVAVLADPNVDGPAQPPNSQKGAETDISTLLSADILALLLQQPLADQMLWNVDVRAFLTSGHSS
jgi:putative tryptophan/tyrosine transport system substrate-binding protein